MGRPFHIVIAIRLEGQIPVSMVTYLEIHPGSQFFFHGIGLVVVFPGQIGLLCKIPGNLPGCLGISHDSYLGIMDQQVFFPQDPAPDHHSVPGIHSLSGHMALELLFDYMVGGFRGGGRLRLGSPRSHQHPQSCQQGAAGKGTDFLLDHSTSSFPFSPSSVLYKESFSGARRDSSASTP